jgi:hypothetical protein
MSPIQFITVKRYLIKETDSTLLIKYIQSRWISHYKWS